MSGLSDIDSGEKDKMARVEEREDVKSSVAEEIKEARRTVRDVRLESKLQLGRQPGYTTLNAANDYLVALQTLVGELEPFANRLDAKPEYWTDQGAPLATLERPKVAIEDVVEKSPEYWYNGGYPEPKDPGALESEVVGVIASLSGLLEWGSAEVPYAVELEVKGGDTITAQGQMVLPRSALDTAWRWSNDYMKEIGLSINIDEGGDEWEV